MTPNDLAVQLRAKCPRIPNSMVRCPPPADSTRAAPGAPRARQLEPLDRRSFPSAMVASGLKWTELFQPELFKRAKIVSRVVVRSVLWRQAV